MIRPCKTPVFPGLCGPVLLGVISFCVRPLFHRVNRNIKDFGPAWPEAGKEEFHGGIQILLHPAARGSADYPDPPDNPPVEIKNYDCDFRIPIPGEAFRAWGELTYTKPLTEKQMEDYELKPSRQNPDLKKRMEEQTQALGKWEDRRHFSDRKRLTWFHPDFGSYVLKDFVTPEQLAERFEIMKELQVERRQKPSISARLQEGAKQAKEHQEPPAKKDGPTHQDR